MERVKTASVVNETPTAGDKPLEAAPVAVGAVTSDGKLRWKKIGGGSFHLDNRIIKPNQIFWARPEEIPKAFRDVVKQLDATPEEKAAIVPPTLAMQPVEETPKVDVEDANYVIQPSSSGWYNIVNTVSGKPINEHKLRKGEAEKLLAGLLGE